MKSYVVLIRGINVGGKNRVPMAALRSSLEKLGFYDVVTYIASGNVLLKTNKKATDVRSTIEAMLPKQFSLDSELIKVLVLTHQQLKAIVDHRPPTFGDRPDLYHSDAIFLIDLESDKAMQVFHPRDGVDMVWPGKGVIYSQRLSMLRTKSRLSKIIGTPEYKSMTIRSWSTTLQLLKMFDDMH